MKTNITLRELNELIENENTISVLKFEQPPVSVHLYAYRDGDHFSFILAESKSLKNDFAFTKIISREEAQEVVDDLFHDAQYKDDEFIEEYLK